MYHTLSTDFLPLPHTAVTARVSAVAIIAHYQYNYNYSTRENQNLFFILRLSLFEFAIFYSLYKTNNVGISILKYISCGNGVRDIKPLLRLQFNLISVFIIVCAFICKYIISTNCNLTKKAGLELATCKNLIGSCCICK